MKKIRLLSVVLVMLMCLAAPAAYARRAKADVYFGYSRVGANLYAVYTPGMNGWQFAAHVKPLPFVGFEGDVSRYSQTIRGFSQQATLVMFGPRVTAHAAGFGVFAHGLGGIAHQNATVTFYPGTGYNATSYALGGGADLPLLLGLKLRATGDYLGNSDAPSASYSPSHYRFGVGVAYHF
jgi:hypothetical protein